MVEIQRGDCTQLKCASTIRGVKRMWRTFNIDGQIDATHIEYKPPLTEYNLRHGFVYIPTTQEISTHSTQG